MSDSLFPIAFVYLGLILQMAALFLHGCRVGALLLLAGGLFVAGFALWEHDAVLLGGQAFIAAALWLLVRPRKKS